VPGIKPFIGRRESQFHNRLKFLHFLGEIFSGDTLLENSCHPHSGAPKRYDEAKKP
jgi:hypothetical protein